MEKIDWNWNSLSAKAFEKFDKYLKSQWKEFNKTPEQNRVASRGETDVNLPFEQVVSFLKDPHSIDHVDNMLEKNQTLQQQGDYEISYLKYKGIFPVSARDFVTLTSNKRIQQNKHIFATVSVDFKYAEEKGTVRGFVECAGYEVVKLGQNKTKVIYISDADPAGSLPGYIKKIVSKGQAEVPLNLKKYLEGKK